MGISAKNNMTITPHPPYSLDSMPCDVPIFQKFKTVLKGRRFNTTVIQAKL
jgi:hypothetical protein